MNSSLTLKKCIKRLAHLYAMNIERHMYMNWFNPLATLYFNIRLLPLRQAVHFPIYVYGNPRILSLYGRVEILPTRGDKKGMVRLNRSRHVAGGPNCCGDNSEFNIWGTIIFRGECQIGTSCKICVGEDGVLEFGDNNIVMSDCNITAYKEVIIGNNLLMAHRSQIFDTGYHYVLDTKRNCVKRIASSIHIGHDCWLCNNSTIMEGVCLPNNTIVASQSLVNKSIGTVAENCILAGIPAKVVATDRKRIIDPVLESKINTFFLNNPKVLQYSLIN